MARATWQAAGLGLLVGIGFILPVLALRVLPPDAGPRRTVALVIATILALLLVRRCGRLLLSLLDRVPRPWRLVLLGLYGLLAMSLPALLLLGWTGPVRI